MQALLDRETAELGQILETTRRKEVKDLAKKHRDRDELIRMKREVRYNIILLNYEIFYINSSCMEKVIEQV